MIRSFSRVYKFTILVIMISISSDLSAADWKYIGLAKIGAGDSFSLFISYRNDFFASGERRFSEKHLFSNPQELPDGTTYHKVVIERTVNCRKMHISDRSAVFSNKKGDVVKYFTQKVITEPKEVRVANSVNFEVFKYICSM